MALSLQAAIYYFDPSRDYGIPHSSPGTSAFIEGVSKWNVDVRHVENELRRQTASLTLARWKKMG